MNKARRKELARIFTILETLHEELEAIRDEEQAYYDNMPESFQNGEKGALACDAIGELDNAVEFVGDAMNNIDTAVSGGS
jgi:hypothetical protein